LQRSSRPDSEYVSLRTVRDCVPDGSPLSVKRPLSSVAVVAAALLALSFLVGRSPGPTLDPVGPVQLGFDPAVVLHHPADPRIRGPGFAATVDGSGLYSAIGPGGNRRYAGRGRRIAVVAVTITSTDQGT